MSDNFKTPSDIFETEITEKKSRFIATIAPVSSEEEAVSFIKDMKKKYWNARHNCSAYIIGTQQQIVHSSDDGEPQGTAGKPILSVLSGRKLYNVVAVVTRYFGGVLLGTGGLVRAYSSAVEECLSKAVLKEMIEASRVKIEASYNDAGKLQYLFSQNNITILSADYTDVVTFDILLPAGTEDFIIKKITETTQNRASVDITDKNYYEL